MDALELAKEKAAERQGYELANAEAVAAKRRRQEAKAGELYAAFASLADARIMLPGNQRAVLEVMRTEREAIVQARELVAKKIDKSRFGERDEIRYLKGKTVLCAWRGVGDEHGYRIQRDNAGVRDVSQIEDVIRFVADEIGRYLILEGE